MPHPTDPASGAEDRDPGVVFAPGPPLAAGELVRIAAEIKLPPVDGAGLWAFRPLFVAIERYRVLYGDSYDVGRMARVCINVKTGEERLAWRLFEIRDVEDGLEQCRRLVQSYGRAWNEGVAALERVGSGGLSGLAERARRTLDAIGAAGADRVRGAVRQDVLSREEEDAAVGQLALLKVYEAASRSHDVPLIPPEAVRSIIRANADEYRSAGIIDRLAWVALWTLPWEATGGGDDDAAPASPPDLTSKKFYDWATAMTGYGREYVRRALEEHPTTARLFKAPIRPNKLKPSRQGTKGGCYPEVLAALKRRGRELTAMRDVDPLYRTSRFGVSRAATDVRKDDVAFQRWI